MIISKLDDYSRKQWLFEKKRRQQVPLSELLEFLEIIAAEAQSSQGETLRNFFQLNQKPKPKFRSVHLIQEGKCLQCEENHNIYRCPKFEELSPQDRSKQIKKWKLCFKCLGVYDKDKCYIS